MVGKIFKNIKIFVLCMGYSRAISEFYRMGRHDLANNLKSQFLQDIKSLD